MTEKESKPVSELRIADLKKNPVWQIMNDDRNAEHPSHEAKPSRRGTNQRTANGFNRRAEGFVWNGQ
ncbi:MAG: hypothetical protein DMG41_36125 [Acidobacteria bacterium]|nr:MAG: hypothetical protein DMG41_36125 [Acidobacteriota bacterium]